MPGPIADEQERVADSPFVAKVRHLRIHAASRELALPDGSWDLLFVRRGDGPAMVIQTGQITAPVVVEHEAGDELLSIAFRGEVYLPRSPGRVMRGRGVVCPLEEDGRFRLGEERFEIPRFDNAEQLVAALARRGVLERDPVVQRALQGASQRLDERSVQRHFAEVAGVGLKAMQQIARAHEAARQLRLGLAASQVAAELGFTDQAHLTHSLKRLLGQTPREIASGGDVTRAAMR